MTILFLQELYINDSAGKEVFAEHIPQFVSSGLEHIPTYLS